MNENASDYSIEELATILQLDPYTMTYDDVAQKVNSLIQQNKTDQEMVYFLTDAQLILQTYIADMDEQAQEEQLRDNQIEIAENDTPIMTQKPLPITNTIDVDVAQDIINPVLKNTSNRFINIDSQFRNRAFSSSNYTVELNEYLSQVLSLRLYSVQIPYTWYTINKSYGNTCFWVILDDTTSINIEISSGNYSPDSLVIELNNRFTNAGIVGASPLASYNASNGKITLSIFDTLYNGITPLSETTQIVFFDSIGKYNCSSNACTNVNNYVVNNTLGWLMGYRNVIELVLPQGNEAQVVLDLYGPKYLVLVLDDFRNNRINSGLISVANNNIKLNYPSYYTPKGDSTECVDGQAVVIPSNPRTLTQAQIYSANEILKSRASNSNFVLQAPNMNDTFALIPMKRGGYKTGDVFVEFGGSLQDNKRLYFGPVDILKLKVRLMDDKGFEVDLNGADWSFTLLAETLYQF